MQRSMEAKPIKVLLSPVGGSELEILLPERARFSRHLLTDDPAAADLILLYGSFGVEPRLLLDHPLYRAHPDKCAVYTEDDHYLPLAPGVYCSAEIDDSSRAGRVAAYSYVCASGRCTNPYVAEGAAGKELLFSFQGGSTSLVRKRLFNLAFHRTDVLIENTSAYHHWTFNEPGHAEQQQRYARTLGASHFVLCPRGAGAGSMRLFEVMQAGVAPVLIADRYALPPGVPWERFLLRVAEKDIARLPEIIEPHRASSAERGRLAREAWREHFSPEKEFDAIVRAGLDTLRHGPPEEAVFRRRQARLIARAERRRKLRGLARGSVLGALRWLRIKPPFQLNG